MQGKNIRRKRFEKASLCETSRTLIDCTDNVKDEIKNKLKRCSKKEC